MGEKSFVTVRVLDLAGAGGGCACGKTAGGPQQTAALLEKYHELKGALEKSYPGQTKTEFIDLGLSPAEKESEVAQLLVTGQYPTPLVVIAGEPRFAGSIQVNKIVKAVAEILNP